jgi:ADP-heptose:LPS heptosyltransferase
MPGSLDRLPDGARAVIVRLRSLGDCVLTTPAIEVLKRARPDLRLAVVVEKRFAGVFEGNPNVDCIMDPAVRSVRAWRAELCLNLHGGTRSMALTALSGARWRAGFAHHCGARIYNLRIPRAQEILGEERTVHTAEHLASAMFWLGAPKVDIPRARLFAEERPASRPYAVIHPFASEPGKAWPAERFAELARRIEETWRLEPVFIGGGGDDFTPFGAWRCMAGTALAEVKSLLAPASLFVGNDSGPAHMAAAFGVPLLVVFGTSDPAIWGPWKAPAQVIAAGPAIGQVKVEEALAALERLKVAA